MIDYTIASHETLYKGVRFRSRLEARYAAFFDKLGWPWEYEPFDLHGWVPDFLISGRKKDTLVEVKPISKPDAEIEDRILRCMDGREESVITAGATFFDSLVSDILVTLRSHCNCGVPHCVWSNRAIVGINGIDGIYDIVWGHFGKFWGTMYGDFQVRDKIIIEEIDEFMGREVRFLWNEAGNVTRWKK